MPLSHVIPLGFGLIFFTVGQLQAAVTENEFSQLEGGDSIVGESSEKPYRGHLWTVPQGIYVKINYEKSVADLRGGSRDAHPSWGSKFFHFHAVFSQIG